MDIDIYPQTLHSVVEAVKYKPGWDLTIVAFAGNVRALGIRVHTTNSLTGEWPVIIGHTFSIPPYAHLWTREECERWVLDQILLVERHEAMEFFCIEGERPFYPTHGQGAAASYQIQRRKAG